MMLDTCSSFASSHSLMFDASKTQLIRFSHLYPLIPLHHTFNGLKLHLSQSAKHLGHILSYNLSDSEDIIRVKKDLVRKASCMLYSSSCSSLVKIKLLSRVCLSLYGSALWFSSSPELSSLKTTFNNILRGSGLFLVCTILAYYIV